LEVNILADITNQVRINMKKKISRHHFIKTGAVAGAGLTFIPPVMKTGKINMTGNPVRLGGPGLGSLDYTVFLQEASKLDNIPLMLEHLEKQEDYKLAADYVREVARKAGITIAE
jgi:sugar phosphate isomerase/epimerase